MAGTLLGAVLSFVWVFNRLRADEREYEAEHPTSTRPQGMKAVGWGVALTVLVTVVLVLYWGRAALLPGLAFGALSTAIEGVALTRLRRTWHEPGTGPLKGFAEGMGLRLAGIAALARRGL